MAPDRVVVLVVEDDPLVRDLISTVLTDEGYDIMAAENGEQALATIGAISPDLLTLDLDLPGIAGDLILAELRRRDETRELPVVIVSANTPFPLMCTRWHRRLSRSPSISMHCSTSSGAVFHRPNPANGALLTREQLRAGGAPHPLDSDRGFLLL